VLAFRLHSFLEISERRSISGFHFLPSKSMSTADGTKLVTD
jgi:hypothetical protein